jgi:hypothetical protein
MVRYNNCSVLRRIDLDDISSLRRIISCLNSEFGNDSLSENKSKQFKLQKLEKAWVNHILIAIDRTARDYPLLHDSIYRFIGADFADDEGISKAAKELEDIADEDILTVPERHAEEYGRAAERFSEAGSQVRNSLGSRSSLHF